MHCLSINCDSYTTRFLKNWLDLSLVCFLDIGFSGQSIVNLDFWIVVNLVDLLVFGGSSPNSIHGIAVFPLFRLILLHDFLHIVEKGVQRHRFTQVFVDIFFKAFFELLVCSSVQVGNSIASSIIKLFNLLYDGVRSISWPPGNQLVILSIVLVDSLLR